MKTKRIIEQLVDDVRDHDITEAMLVYGGNFASKLADAWRAGDEISRNRVKAAFPELWREYRSLVAARRRSAKR